jgi:hypothetical protein
LAGSLGLHLLLIAVLIWSLHDRLRQPLMPDAIAVDLVSLGAPTQSPPEPTQVRRPTAPPEPISPAAEPAPRSEAPPPATVEPKSEGTRHIDPLAELSPPPKPKPPIAGTGERLKSTRAIHRTTPLPRPSEPTSAGNPADTVETGTDAAARGPASYNVKDLIRTQIERRWNFDVKEASGADENVSIHLVIDPGGTIETADIVSDPRLASDRAYRDLAISARDAALISSPLQLPPGALSAVADMQLSFSPRDVLR